MKRSVLTCLLFVLLLLQWRRNVRMATSAFHILSQLYGDDDGMTPSLSTLPSSAPKHVPRRFSTNTTLNMERGLNIINGWSGQQMTTWVYNGMLPVEGNPKSNTWSRGRAQVPPSKLLYTANDTSRLQPNDTIFVGYFKLGEFATDFLPFIHTDVVLVSSAFGFGNQSQEVMEPRAHAVVSHSHILKLFATDTPMHTGGFQDHDKVHSFPLGLKPHLGKAAYRNPIPYYRKAFLEAWNNGNPLNKTNTLYLSPIRDTNLKRKEIVQQPEYVKAQSNRIVAYEEYLRHVAASHFVLSPDGDHPDCHRHYEAIGVGAVPITNLNLSWYKHLREADTMDGISLYDNDMSNLTTLQAKLEQLSPPQVNRNMIFEEYYMEYMEGVVGRPLRWWDVAAGRPALLNEFATTVNNTAR